MAFFRRKKLKNESYWYLVESYRDEQGKPRQRVLHYLGNEDGEPREKNRCISCGKITRTWRGVCPDCYTEAKWSDWEKGYLDYYSITCDECEREIPKKEWFWERSLTVKYMNSSTPMGALRKTLKSEIYCSKCYNEVESE